MAFFVTAAVIGAGASLIGGAVSANAAKNASDAQVAASEKATGIQKQSVDKQLALQEKMFNKQNELQEPFRQAGLTSQNRLLDLLGLSGNTKVAGYGTAAQNFTPSDLTSDPGYQFRLSEGLKALDASAASRGGLLSGNAGRALVDYGQVAGSQEYQNAFNRYNTNRANILNPLQSLTNQGQSSSNTMGAAAGSNAFAGSGTLSNYGTNAANLAVNAGNAIGSGYVNQANSWNNALSNINNVAGQYATGMARYGNGGYGAGSQNWYGSPTSGYGFTGPA